MSFITSILITLGLLLSSDFSREAEKQGVDPKVVEGVCRYESDSGRLKVNKNRNGSWDVGYCQNHRPPAKKRPPIPSNQESVKEAAIELKYWKRQHQSFCVDLLEEQGKCGEVRYGKWRGIRNCRRAHPWYGHYNWGFRVLRNGYGRKVKCFIKNNFEKCNRKQLKQVQL